MSRRGPAPRAVVWGLLVGYALVLLGGLALLSYARRATIAALDTPAAREQWDKWKRDETARQTQGAGPVRRRAPKSDEPPGLVLMRDSFPGIVAGSVAIGSFVYGCGAWIVLEVARRRAPARDAPR